LAAQRDLYARSRFYVAAPSRWLIDKLARSMVAPAVIESRVIPNGVDSKCFVRALAAARAP
jgi:hypothetical protein